MIDDETEQFFARLAEGGHNGLLDKVTGRVAFHLTSHHHSDHWLVDIAKGDVSVLRCRAKTPADSSISTTRALFNKIIAGRTNALAATLRGALTVDGSLELLVLFQRIFPGAATTAKPRTEGTGLIAAKPLTQAHA